MIEGVFKDMVMILIATLSIIYFIGLTVAVIIIAYKDIKSRKGECESKKYRR